MAAAQDMAEEYRGVPFTRKEAETAVRTFVRTTVDLRHQLLELFERRAHHALDYDRFEEFSEEKLGIKDRGGYLKQMRQWARVERDVIESFRLPVYAQTGNLAELNSANPGLSRHVAIELAKLPEGTRREAYQESIALGATGRRALQCVKHIVTRRLNEAKGIRPEIAAPRERKQIGAPAPDPLPEVTPDPAPVAPAAAPAELELLPPVDDTDKTPWVKWAAALRMARNLIDVRSAATANVQDRKAVSERLIEIARWVGEGK